MTSEITEKFEVWFSENGYDEQHRAMFEIVWRAAIPSREPMSQQQQAGIIHPDDDMATFIRTIASVERFHGIGE